MTVQHEIGNLGEQIAVEYLTQKGYKIVELNWRSGKAEIDIIAKHGNELVFIEVKTRSSDYYGPPASFVDSKKIDLITTAAQDYISIHGFDGELRFDIIGILIKNDNPEITHFEDAFFKGL